MFKQKGYKGFGKTQKQKRNLDKIKAKKLKSEQELKQFYDKIKDDRNYIIEVCGQEVIMAGKLCREFLSYQLKL